MSDDNTLRPVAPGERIEILDVLRGFALTGVLFSNLASSARQLKAPAKVLATVELDLVIGTLSYYLVSGKFYVLFTLLFGIGFSVQAARAADRGVSIVPVYSRRLAWLVVIGAVNAVFFWWGDVLIPYALAGVVLLALRNRSDRTILVLGVILTFLPSFHWTVITLLQGRGAGTNSAAVRAATSPGRELLGSYAEGGYSDAMALNLNRWVTTNVSGTLATWPLWYLVMGSLGLFLLGYWAGRRRYFHATSENRRFFRQLGRWGLFVGLAATLLLALARTHRIGPASPLFVPMLVVRRLHIVSLALFYMSVVVGWFEKDTGRRWLGWLAPVGRTALSNYLLQSVGYLVILSGVGFGLAGRISAAVCVPITVAFFAAQAWGSAAYLRRFRIGPAEWLWRSLTYGERQPLSAPRRTAQGSRHAGPLG